MVDLANSHSLTEFQRNARGFIETLNETKQPTLLTVNGKVQAVLIDPATFREMEDGLESVRFVAALKEGLADLDAGRTRPLGDVVTDLKSKHGL